MLKAKMLKLFRFGLRLRIDKLEFLAGGLDELTASFRTYTNPINSRRRYNSTVCFYCYLKAAGLDCGDQIRIKLEEGFSTRHHDESSIGRASPGLLNGFGQGCCGF